MYRMLPLTINNNRSKHNKIRFENLSKSVKIDLRNTCAQLFAIVFIPSSICSVQLKLVIKQQPMNVHRRSGNKEAEREKMKKKWQTWRCIEVYSICHEHITNIIKIIDALYSIVANVFFFFSLRLFFQMYAAMFST